MLTSKTTIADAAGIDVLKKLGADWQKNELHRIYFNDLPGLYGLKCNHYNTGNISSAMLDGEDISNSEAKRIEGRLSMSKFWFDFADGHFHGKDIELDDFNALIREIKSRLPELPAAVEVSNA